MLSNEDACKLETSLIAKTKNCYNTAKGGDGGLTMTREQLESQYAIKTEQYSEFEKLFKKGLTQSI